MAVPLVFTLLLGSGLAILYPVFEADDQQYVYLIWALSSIAALAGFFVRRPMIVAAVGVTLGVVYFIVFVWDSESFGNDEYGGLYVIAWTIGMSIPIAAWSLSALAGYLWWGC